MSDLRERIDELADLMAEYGLDEAQLRGEGWRIGFSRVGPQTAPSETEANSVKSRKPQALTAPAPQAGTPISSPMTGIFYTSPSPGSPAFVKEGESVVAGQVIGLIEAMKVFNEITATMNGAVLRIAAQSGQLVNPGDPLVYIG